LPVSHLLASLSRPEPLTGHYQSPRTWKTALIGNMKSRGKSLTNGLLGKVNMDSMATGMNRRHIISSASTTLLHLLPPSLNFFLMVILSTSPKACASSFSPFFSSKGQPSSLSGNSSIRTPPGTTSQSFSFTHTRHQVALPNEKKKFTRFAWELEGTQR
jgi:hypothetical protein